MSPVTFKTVRPMSQIRSMATIIPMYDTGIPRVSKTIASIIVPDPGTPAVPTEDKTVVITTTVIWLKVRCNPAQEATKTVATD